MTGRKIITAIASTEWFLLSRYHASCFTHIDWLNSYNYVDTAPQLVDPVWIPTGRDSKPEGIGENTTGIFKDAESTGTSYWEPSEVQLRWYFSWYLEYFSFVDENISLQKNFNFHACKSIFSSVASDVDYTLEDLPAHDQIALLIYFSRICFKFKIKPLHHHQFIVFMV